MRVDAGWGGFGTHFEVFLTTAIAITATVVDASRKKAASAVDSDCCVCYEVLVPPMVYLGSCLN